ncbi:MAG: hypothetical protein AAFO79_10160, partial [Pseudomonadota bacterium]
SPCAAQRFTSRCQRTRVRPLQVEALKAKDERQIRDLEALQPIKLKGIASRPLSLIIGSEIMS